MCCTAPLALAQRGLPLVGEPVGPLGGRPHPDHVDPAPMFVEELTSGLTVTTRRAVSSASLVRSRSTPPSAAWVDALPYGVRPKSAASAGIK